MLLLYHVSCGNNDKALAAAALHDAAMEMPCGLARLLGQRFVGAESLDEPASCLRCLFRRQERGVNHEVADACLREGRNGRNIV